MTRYQTKIVLNIYTFSYFTSNILLTTNFFLFFIFKSKQFSLVLNFVKSNMHLSFVHLHILIYFYIILELIIMYIFFLKKICIKDTIYEIYGNSSSYWNLDSVPPIKNHLPPIKTSYPFSVRFFFKHQTNCYQFYLDYMKIRLFWQLTFAHREHKAYKL